MTLWVNGSMVADDQPVIRGDDHGLVVGDGVFETAKVVGGRVFARSRHLRRLTASARGLGLEVDESVVQQGIDAVLDRTPGDARLRITVTGGPSPYGSGRGDATPTVLVAAAPLTRWPTTANLIVVPWSRNENAATTGLKTTSYADNVVALAYAHDHGADEALFANTKGELCEGTGTNVFIGVGGQVATPPLSSGCLAGITRQLVIEWLGDIEERRISMAELAQANEVFITSSTRDVQAVAAVNDRQLPHAPGPLTQRAIDAFRTNSEKDIDP